MAALPHLPVSLLTAERDESGPVLRGEGEWAKEAATANPTWAGLVSVILPTLNEECIDASLQKLTDHLLRIDRPFEILIVDDSSDENRRALRACVARYAGLAPRIQLAVIDGARKGKGCAVKFGARAARGEITFVIDADLPVPLAHIEGFLGALDASDRDIVIGARPMTRDLTRPLRLMLSRVLSFFVHAVVFQRVVYSDTQCGFKAFRTETLRSLADKQEVDGGMYDVEYLYVARLERRKVLSVPVVALPETRPSKIKVMKCIYTDPLSLVSIKLRGALGRYKTKPTI